MSAIECAHQTATESAPVCAHLFGWLQEASGGFPAFDLYRAFTGRGREFNLLCTACKDAVAARVTDPTIRLHRVCPTCVEAIEAEVWWDGNIGMPEVLVRPSTLAFQHEIRAVAGLQPGAVRDIQPVDGTADSVWIALTGAGDLVRLDLTAGTTTRLMSLPPSRLDPMLPVSLHVDRHGRLAAVVNTHGQFGVVVDLLNGAETMRLDRGNYRTENASFSIAFFERNGAPLLVNATSWNRLDISDPATGRLLTERTWPAPTSDEARPPHYLGYFHASLLVSPDQEWIADHGWVWTPAGIVRSWSLTRWNEENVWESEDGPSVQAMCQRLYFWDGPWCWVGNRTLATWGYGTDDLSLTPAAWLVDVESGAEVGWFAGPTGPFVFDKYLFSLGGGIAVWDIATGERLLLDSTR